MKLMVFIGLMVGLISLNSVKIQAATTKVPKLRIAKLGKSAIANFKGDRLTVLYVSGRSSALPTKGANFFVHRKFAWVSVKLTGKKMVEIPSKIVKTTGLFSFNYILVLAHSAKVNPQDPKIIKKAKYLGYKSVQKLNMKKSVLILQI